MDNPKRLIALQGTPHAPCVDVPLQYTRTVLRDKVCVILSPSSELGEKSLPVLTLLPAFTTSTSRWRWQGSVTFCIVTTLHPPTHTQTQHTHTHTRLTAYTMYTHTLTHTHMHTQAHAKYTTNRENTCTVHSGSGHQIPCHYTIISVVSWSSSYPMNAVVCVHSYRCLYSNIATTLQPHWCCAQIGAMEV